MPSINVDDISIFGCVPTHVRNEQCVFPMLVIHGFACVTGLLFEQTAWAFQEHYILCGQVSHGATILRALKCALVIKASYKCFAEINNHIQSNATVNDSRIFSIVLVRCGKGPL